MTAACLLVRSPACSARQLQTSIVQVVHLCPTGFRKEPCERLERHKPKGLRVVLRGLGSSNAPRLPGGGGGDVTSLPDTWVGNHPGLPGPDFLPGFPSDTGFPSPDFLPDFLRLPAAQESRFSPWARAGASRCGGRGSTYPSGCGRRVTRRGDWANLGAGRNSPSADRLHGMAGLRSGIFRAIMAGC